ncbi:large ribosomal subunit protein uL1-like [Amblyomma americanum]
MPYTEKQHTIFSTRVNLEVLNEGVRAVFDEASHRRRKFVETVELQIAFKKAYGKKTLAPVPFRLQHPTKHNFKVCVLGDEQRCLEARANKVDCLDLEGILQKKKKPSGVKHLVKKYDAFLVPTSMMKDVQDQIGFSLKKAHKVPLPLESEDSVVEKAKEAKTTLRFNMKKDVDVQVQSQRHQELQSCFGRGQLAGGGLQQRAASGSVHALALAEEQLVDLPGHVDVARLHLDAGEVAQRRLVRRRERLVRRRQVFHALAELLVGRRVHPVLKRTF